MLRAFPGNQFPSKNWLSSHTIADSTIRLTVDQAVSSSNSSKHEVDRNRNEILIHLLAFVFNSQQTLYLRPSLTETQMCDFNDESDDYSALKT